MASELRYKAFGEIRHANGKTPTDYRYTGQRQQADIGLYFYNARWYDPALGRFTSADTIVPGAESPQAWDRYSYVLNNPINMTDPSGHCGVFGSTPLDPIGGIANCLESIKISFDAWSGGERNPVMLGLHYSGFTHAMRKAGDAVDAMNNDVAVSFSDAPLLERLPHAVKLGTFATLTSTAIVGGAQMAAQGAQVMAASRAATAEGLAQRLKVAQGFELHDCASCAYAMNSKFNDPLVVIHNPSPGMNLTIPKGVDASNGYHVVSLYKKYAIDPFGVHPAKPYLQSLLKANPQAVSIGPFPKYQGIAQLVKFFDDTALYQTLLGELP